MRDGKNPWGLPLFITACIAGGAVVYASPAAGTAPPAGRIILPISGLVFSGIALFIGTFSYPRVHNLKVYLAGYSAAIHGIGYFGFVAGHFLLRLEPPRPGYVLFLYLLAGANGMLLCMVPSFTKYRTGRHITFWTVGAQFVMLLCIRFVPAATAWAGRLDLSGWGDWRWWAGILWLPAVIVMSRLFMRRLFHLGGIVSGYALFYGLAWACRPYRSGAEGLLFAAAPLFLVGGTIVHWLSRMGHRVAYDPLLQIYNRDYCGKIIAEQSNVNVTPPFAVAMVDIDRFKRVNDTYGHQTGDQVLHGVAQAICREVVPDGIVCRYGGEEIAIFFPRKSARAVLPVMENVRRTVPKVRVRSGRKNVAVTVSTGISHRESMAQDIASVIAAADKALYRAKKNGRNRIHISKTPTGGSRRSSTQRTTRLH